MWFGFALITFLAWGTADLFYKKSAEPSERYSHLLTAAVVGIVMGLTAAGTILIEGIDYRFENLLVYLPVSAMYILSMTVGYFGLRYLELSVSSPIQNASGAVTSILLILVFRRLPDPLTAAALVLITAGVILLGVFERAAVKDEITENDRRYSIGFAAFFMPILYCVIDSFGTFLDGYYLDDISTTPLIGVTEDNFEAVANISYQLTFFIAAVLILLYVCVIKKQKIVLKRQGNRVAAAALETAGQFTYVYAMAGHAVAAAPVIASYCVASAILARIFLREKLSKKQYAAVALVLAGIILLGVLEGLAEA